MRGKRFGADADAVILNGDRSALPLRPGTNPNAAGVAGPSRMACSALVTRFRMTE